MRRAWMKLTEFVQGTRPQTSCTVTVESVHMIRGEIFVFGADSGSEWDSTQAICTPYTDDPQRSIPLFQQRTNGRLVQILNVGKYSVFPPRQTLATYPEAAVASTEQRLDSFGQWISLRSFPFHKTYPIETKQTEVRCHPKIPIGCLCDRNDATTK